MSAQTKTRRNTISDIIKRKGLEPVVCLTAYTAPMARMMDQHVDLILVGDSLGMVVYGMDSTVPVSLDLMINHGRAVVKSSEHALVVIDMPFGSYQEGPDQAFRNAALIMKETGAAAVKLEGGAEMAGTISFLTRRGVPVMGHIGLQPQSVHATGGYKVIGRAEQEHLKVMTDAAAIDQTGAFAVVLECMDPDLAGEVTEKISIPTIGIGASASCDGQILVTEDMVGLSGHKPPKFVKKYADLEGDLEQAIRSYSEDVRDRSYPAEEHLYRRVSDTGKIKVIK